ncbi:replication initiation protein [Paraclostridium sordellii]|uniref:replication initiation protein n=1 Tax=Paraclostridium sordellii TaxID=1505 RepID=UPI0005E007C4|nr:replication initiation protein [Paeniclostridium sordellii]CEN21238.1 putative replication initiator protein [[Clostridium] sordellii] [Paeniclostridium sordellii]
MKNKDKENKILNKHNLLVKTKYHLNTIEMKTYLFILYKAQALATYRPCDILVESEFSSFYMNREDFKYIRDGKQVLEKARLEKILDSLMVKPIYWEDPNVKKEKWSKFCFIGKQKYNSENDSFKILLPIEVYNMLTKYMDEGYGYTPENLSILLAAKCTYTYRLYELLRLWSNSKNEVTYSIEELKDLFMLEDKKSYSVYANFKNKVIIPAKNELEELNLFEIDFKEIKKGQKVVGITFYIKDLDKRKYFEKNVVKEVIECEENGNNEGLELLNEGNYTNTQEIQKEELKIENRDFYIPDETVFTKGTLRSFKLDFENINFKNKYMKNAFDDSVMITLDRDDVETIKATSYKFFKGTLDNKIEEYKKEEAADIKHQEEMKWNW